MAVEAPLEIRVAGRPLAVTLRTPGHDVELALGFLLAEGVIESADDVTAWRVRAPSSDRDPDGHVDELVAEIELAEAALDRWARRRVQREFRSNSACGACGKPSLEDLHIEPLRAGDPAASASGPIEPTDLGALIDRALADQPLFRLTGAVHGAAAFDREGQCLAVFEDVGRHNAMDKLIGWALLGRSAATGVERGVESEGRPVDGSDELLDELLVLSTGRAGFEIVQKALRARAAGVLALGAATDWAVELARHGGMALIGFGGGEPVRYC